MKKIISIILVMSFALSCLMPPRGFAQAPALSLSNGLNLPQPGIMVSLSPAFTPAYLKGMVIDPKNPFKFDFIIYRGDEPLSVDQKQPEYTKLIKYFLAALAVPDTDQWVNLSPYEKDRIIPDNFGLTEMGRDLLAQDYILKQIAASLTNPDSELGKKFWDKVYAEAYQKFGTTDIPTDAFNKVWIVPDKAVIYEKGTAVYVLEHHLKVMLESDYVAQQEAGSKRQEENASSLQPPASGTTELSKQILREIIIPAIEKEVNEGKNFAPLRQVYSGMLLAAWYKRALKESILTKVYGDQSKVKGIDQSPENNQLIYERYVEAFKKGAFNMIREDVDRLTQELIPRKYFSGGMVSDGAMFNEIVDHAQSISPEGLRDAAMADRVSTALLEPPSAPSGVKDSEAGKKRELLYYFRLFQHDYNNFLTPLNIITAHGSLKDSEYAKSVKDFMKKWFVIQGKILEETAPERIVDVFEEYRLGARVKLDELKNVPSEIGQDEKKMMLGRMEAMDLVLSVGLLLKEEVQPLDLVAFIRKMGILFSSSAALEVEAEPGFSFLFSRPHFFRVLNNLFTNAVQATAGSKATITIAAEKADVDGEKMVRISVRDNGPGLTPDQVKAFNDKGRLDTTKEGGHGIGLASVTQIIKEYGGTIMIKSSQGEDHGTTFTILLPDAAMKDRPKGTFDVLKERAAAAKKEMESTFRPILDELLPKITAGTVTSGDLDRIPKTPPEMVFFKVPVVIELLKKVLIPLAAHEQRELRRKARFLYKQYHESIYKDFSLEKTAKSVVFDEEYILEILEKPFVKYQESFNGLSGMKGFKSFDGNEIRTLEELKQIASENGILLVIERDERTRNFEKLVSWIPLKPDAAMLGEDNTFRYPAGPLDVTLHNRNKNYAKTSEGAVSVGMSMLHRSLVPDKDDFPSVIVAPPSGSWVGRDGSNIMQIYFAIAANFAFHGRKTTVVVRNEEEKERIIRYLDLGNPYYLPNEAGYPQEFIDQMRREAIALADRDSKLRIVSPASILENDSPETTMVDFKVLTDGEARIGDVRIIDRKDGTVGVVDGETESVLDGNALEGMDVAIEGVERLKVAPEFGVTFLGTSSGMDAKGVASSQIIWAGRKGILIDAGPAIIASLVSKGISSSNMEYVALTHMHEDHAAGMLAYFAWLKKNGRSIKMLVEPGIYKLFKEQAEIVLNAPLESVYDVEVVPLKFNETTVLGAGEDAVNIKTIPAFHGTPTMSLRVSYRGKTIAHSSDTTLAPLRVDAFAKTGLPGIPEEIKADLLKFTDYKDGQAIFDLSRAQEIKNGLFSPDESGRKPDLVIFEAGYGKPTTVSDTTNHTSPYDLGNLPAKDQKLILANHTAQLPLDASPFISHAPPFRTVDLSDAAMGGRPKGMFDALKERADAAKKEMESTFRPILDELLPKITAGTVTSGDLDRIPETPPEMAYLKVPVVMELLQKVLAQLAAHEQSGIRGKARFLYKQYHESIYKDFSFEKTDKSVVFDEKYILEILEDSSVSAQESINRLHGVNGFKSFDGTEIRTLEELKNIASENGLLLIIERDEGTKNFKKLVSWVPLKPDAAMTGGPTVIMDLYKKGDSKKFRQSLADIGLVPDEVINELRAHTERYLREKIDKTIFVERPKGAQKRVFEDGILDFLVGFEYNLHDLGPTQILPASFETAYERGGDLVGRIYYLKDVSLRYIDGQGRQQTIFVPYLLVQEKLVEFGKRIEELTRDWTKVDLDLINDLMGQFIELHKNMYRRGFSNWDVKIAINYGVTRDNRVVLLDTGGIRKEKVEPIISWHIPMPFGITEPAYKKELSWAMESMWESDLDVVARSTFVNPDLEGPLRDIMDAAIRKVSTGDHAMTLEEAYNFLKKEFNFDIDHDLDSSRSLAETIVKQNNPAIKKVLIVGDGLRELPVLLALMGKDVTWVNEEVADRIEGPIRRAKHKLKRENVDFDLKIKLIWEDIGSLDFKENGLKIGDFDLITFIDMVGGTPIGSPRQWLSKAKELLKPEGYIVMDITKHAQDTTVRYFPSIFPDAKLIARWFSGTYSLLSANWLYQVGGEKKGQDEAPPGDQAMTDNKYDIDAARPSPATKPTILLAEDDGIVGLNIQSQLGNYNVILAMDGGRALEEFMRLSKEGNIPRAVLTDFQMPDKDGAWLIQELRKLGYKDERIVMTTDLPVKDAQARAGERGVSLDGILFVNKTNLGEMETVVNNISSAETDSAMVKGGIDFAGRSLDMQIRRDGNGVPLPVSEQNLDSIHIDGLVPVILDIRPALTAPLFSEAVPVAEPAPFAYLSPAREPEQAGV